MKRVWWGENYFRKSIPDFERDSIVKMNILVIAVYSYLATSVNYLLSRIHHYSIFDVRDGISDHVLEVEQRS